MCQENKLIVITGPTASGKTELAVQLAIKFAGEIISADSRQVYRGLDIGTGKDLKTYQIGGQEVKYHLINHVDAGDKYNIHQFKNDFALVYRDIIERGKVPILCGGTAMYIHQLLQPKPFTSIPVNENLRLTLEMQDKERLISQLSDLPLDGAKIDLTSKKRLIRAIEIGTYLKWNELPKQEDLDLKYIVIGLRGDREHLRERIGGRLKDRMQEGMLEEAKNLIKQGLSYEMMQYYGLEYKFMAEHLKGEISEIEMLQRLSVAICQYAKRQETYLRKMEKDGVFIDWIDFSLAGYEKERRATNLIEKFLNN